MTAPSDPAINPTASDAHSDIVGLLVLVVVTVLLVEVARVSQGAAVTIGLLFGGLYLVLGMNKPGLLTWLSNEPAVPPQPGQPVTLD